MKHLLIPEGVPQSSRGLELAIRFDRFAFRQNPLDSPMAQVLIGLGYEVTSYPLYQKYVEDDYLACEVRIKGLEICFRQPTPTDLMVCFIRRVDEKKSFASALMGITRFFAILRDHSPITFVGGNIYKNNVADDLSLGRLFEFYHRHLGGIEYWPQHEEISIYAEVQAPERYLKCPLWQKDDPTVKERYSL